MAEGRGGDGAGALPSQSRLAFQVKVALLGAVADEDLSWGDLKATWR